jgi:hypothetical protein
VNTTTPPQTAIWLLRHVCPGDNDALTGDLIEQWRDCRSNRWFWKQVVIALGLGLAPHLTYATVATAMQWFLWQTIDRLTLISPLHWYALSWPWSMLIFESRNTAVLNLAALVVLAVALRIAATFHWRYVLRTGAIAFTLISIGHYLPIAFPTLLLRHEVPDAGMMRVVLPPLALTLSMFGAFLLSAWIGCQTRQRSKLAA